MVWYVLQPVASYIQICSEYYYNTNELECKKYMLHKEINHVYILQSISIQINYILAQGEQANKLRHVY